MKFGRVIEKDEEGDDSNEVKRSVNIIPKAIQYEKLEFFFLFVQLHYSIFA